MKTAPALMLASSLALGALALESCSSSHATAHATGSSGAGASDGGAPDAGGGGATGAGGSTPGADGGDASAPSLYGDRDLGVVEPYPDAVLIQNGGRFYNVMSPPTSAQHAAKGDGTTDDTPAILDAFDYLKAAYVAANPSGSPTAGYDGSNYWLYFPNGTYRVTSTLSYRGATLVTPTFGSDLVRIRVLGQSREGTTLKLDDATAAFGDATNPAVLLEFQHDGTTFNNAPASNVLANLTLDTGSGNPGAIGLWFQGANLTSMHNVLVKSGDGGGHCGMIFQTGSVQGYYRDLTVEGFDYGLCQTTNPEVDSAFEHVTLRGQNVAGVLVQGGGTSMRRFLIDESETTAEGVRLEKSGGVVILDASLLQGSAGAVAVSQAATTGEALFVRDLVTSGFGSVLTQADAGADAGSSVSWFASYPPVVLLDGGIAPSSLGLPVEDTPLPTWFDPATDWADVDTFGAKGDGTTDDSAAIQAAMASGKPVVVFPKTSYLWKTTITIPATVKRVDFMYADTQGSVKVAEASADPLRLSYHSGYGQVALGAARTVVLADWSGSFTNPSAIAGSVFLENVANVGGDPSFCPAGQTTWARSLNDELGSGTADILVNGGTLWLFGYKTENKPVTSVLATGGARVEVLNGYVNMTVAPGATTMVENDGSQLSYIGFTNLGSAIQGPFENILHETEDGGSATLTYDAGFGGALPARGGTYKADFVVPLYVGGR
jgi:hypothetical protein